MSTVFLVFLPIPLVIVLMFGTLYFMDSDRTSGLFGMISLWAITGIIFCQLWIYDGRELTAVSRSYQLADKYHEEVCDPIIDGDGNYAGESCGDSWSLIVINSDGQRDRITVNGDVFKSFLVGSHIRHSWNRGRLGYRRDARWEQIVE